MHRCGPSYREQLAKKFPYTATAIGLVAKKLEEVGLVEREVKHLPLRRRAGKDVLKSVREIAIEDLW